MVNLAPYSFFNAVGYRPMTVMFCPQLTGDLEEKDTLRNAKPPAEGGTGEFVLNLATEPLTRAVAVTAERLPSGESEVELAGLEMAPSVQVRAPRVARSPVAFECRTTRVLRDLDPDVPDSTNVVVFGRVVWIHVHDEVIDARTRLDPDKLRAIGRMAGISYASTRDRADVPSGRAALLLPEPFDG